MPSLIERMRDQHKLKEGDRLGIKFALNTEVKVDGEARTVRAIANTAAIDLQDEVVIPSGAEKDSMGQPVYFGQARTIFLNHDYTQPIGKLRTAHEDRGGWQTFFHVSDKTQTARETFLLIQERIINGVSIGFKANDWGRPTTEEIKLYGPASAVVRKWTWIELSVTPVPCNPEAWITDVKSAPADDVVTEIRKMVAGGHVSGVTAKALGVDTQGIKTRRVVFIGS
jgi:HK97 family phage prohead protease